jgi:hypothetical protein
MKGSIEFSIISGSNEDLIVQCLDSLYAALSKAPFAASVTATCNTPGTGLAGKLESRFPGIRTIVNERPRGFAANHNTVLRASNAEYVWLLNDDLIFFPDTVDKLTAFLSAPGNERIATATPRLLNPDGSLQPSTYSFPSVAQTILAYSGLREARVVDRLLEAASPVVRRRQGSSRFWDHDRIVDVDTFRGACMAVRMAAVREVGPMVEVSQVGAEELEWHRRFHEAGWRVVFFPDASVIHIGSQTVRSGLRSIYAEYLKGSLYYFRVHHSRASYYALLTGLSSMFGIKTAFAFLTRDSDNLREAQRYNRVIRDGFTADFKTRIPWTQTGP